MANKPEKKPRNLTRREVLAGATAAAFVAAVRPAFAKGQRARSATPSGRTTAPVLRYMAAAAPLGDGRVLITGGYDQPWTGGAAPRALSSVVVYNPSNGEYANAAQMRFPRARHAAVQLQDGRVAVIGGISASPTASIEVYDPSTDSWSVSQPLTQPRYDHVAVSDGNSVFVFGGSGQSMLASIETVYPGGVTDF